MLITPHDMEKFRNNPLEYMKIMQENIQAGNTQFCYAKEPLIDNFPKDEGIFFIYGKILELEELSTENIANALLNYIPFMRKHNIKIIKEYDSKCSLSYNGEIPKIKVKNFETEAFYGFNKFQIVDANTLSRKEDIETNIYLETIDFTYALDSNAASFFERYYKDGNKEYESLYKEIIAENNNIDIGPYIFETIMNGLLKYGINYKLNKKHKNEDQAAFFQNIAVLYQAGLFKAKLEKVFINNIIKKSNPLIEYYGVVGYGARIFLIIMLEAKYKYWESPNKIKDFVYSEMRNLNQPIDNRLKAILYLFTEKPGHPFFNKVINIKNIINLEEYLEKVDNTARDIALSLSDKYVYARMGIFPFLASDDKGFIKMLQDTKPDYIFKYDNMEVPVYKNINKDMQKKHLEFFETDTPQACKFQDSNLKELMKIYKEKYENFIKLIDN